LNSRQLCRRRPSPARNLAKSRDFIRECQAVDSFDVIPDALGSYEEIIASPRVDAIYLPLPTGLRKEFVLRRRCGGETCPL